MYNILLIGDSKLIILPFSFRQQLISVQRRKKKQKKKQKKRRKLNQKHHLRQMKILEKVGKDLKQTMKQYREKKRPSNWMDLTLLR